MPTRGRDAAMAIALFSFGLLVNLYYGRLGFMPLDQGIVFDGAWRMMQGQVPYRDFTAPNALVPSLLQVPYFAVFGVTWFAFVLHASVINGLFSAGTYALLRRLEASRLEAAAFAALTAFFFYPPNGTPFMDQHAFFFTALAFATVYVGSTTASARHARWCWIVLPWLLALGYFSKQIPTAFGALAIAGFLVIQFRRAGQWLGDIVLGGLMLLAVATALWLVLGLSLEAAWQSLVSMPLDIARERTPGDTGTAPIRLVVGTTVRIPAWASLWSVYIALAGGAALVAARATSHWLQKGWMLAAIMFTTGAFSAYTLNQLENSYCLLMLAAGVGCVALRGTVERLAPRHQRLARAASVVLIALATRDTVVFARDIDATRVVLDTTFDRAVADQAGRHLPAAMQFMEWTDVKINAEQFGRLFRFLSAAPHNFVLISDLTPLYALTKKPSTSPALWLHPGLTIPRSGTAAFARFEERLLSRIREYDVRYVVIDEPYTGRFVRLVEFPQLRGLIEETGCAEHRFGEVRVVQLCPKD
jgi:hypothetical protein